MFLPGRVSNYMATIHPTAIVDPRAELADGVSIGAYSIIKGPVHLAADTIVHEHTHIHGKTYIGQRCELGPTAFIGLNPQHLTADLTIGELEIGDNVVIRETATVHRSTAAGRERATKIGNNCFLMGGVHIAHDCELGEAVILANSALLGGHCKVGSQAFLGGGSALHQFVRIGRLAIVGGNETCTQEVPPFAAVRDGGMRAYNAIGCKRAGMSRDSIRAIRTAYRIIHSNRLIDHAVREIRALVGDVPEVREILSFIADIKRGLIPSVAGRRDVFDDSVTSMGQE